MSLSQTVICQVTWKAGWGVVKVTGRMKVASQLTLEQKAEWTAW